MNILDEIVEKRKADIKKIGINFDCNIPKKRKNSIVPFLFEKGIILEIKRASPSKGDISPNLDAIKTATEYAKAGAKAISVLTENNYFKGSLDDLKNVSDVLSTISERSAILRKDFLLSEQEIDVAYKCGADAVLLIARILDDGVLLEMVKKCLSLKISYLLELRVEDDLRKLSLIKQKIGYDNMVLGVNSRDLGNFQIDLLWPCVMMKKIQAIVGNDARIIFESGIRTPKAANFIGSLGFHGLLLGEAVAKNANNAKKFVSSFMNAHPTKNALFWMNFSQKLETQKRPLIKICGLTNKEDALNAVKLGATFIGFIFSKKSPRNVSEKLVEEIISAVNMTIQAKSVIKVAVVTDCTTEEALSAIHLVENGTLDVLQLHGKQATDDFFSSDFQELPHYCVVNVENGVHFDSAIEKIDELRALGEPRILLDAKVGEKIGGTGEIISSKLCKKVSKKIKLWLAGGISPDNLSKICKELSPELLDINSGIEEAHGKKSVKKMQCCFY